MEKLFKQRDCLTQEEIKLYLSEQLQEDIRFEVENHLLDCPLCADAVEGFEQMDMTEMDAALARMDEKFNRPLNVKPIASSKRISSRLIFLRAAAILLAISLPVGVVMYWSESKEERLFAAHFSDYPGGFDYTSRTQDSTQMLKELFFRALQLYNKQKYEESLVLLRQHLAEKNGDLEAKFFAGLCYLETGKTKLAAEMLEPVVADATSGFSLDATWYLALAKLKMGDVARAKSLFTLLTQSGGYHGKDAADLLIEMGE